MSWLDELRVGGEKKRRSKVGLVELRTWTDEGTELVVRGKLDKLEMHRDFVDVSHHGIGGPATYLLTPAVTTATIMSLSGEIWPDEEKREL